MKSLVVATMAFFLGGQSFAQTPPAPAGIPVQMVVTAEQPQSSEPVAISLNDIAAWQGRTRLPVVAWAPLGAERDAGKPGVELFVFIDERVDPAQTAVFDQLRQFVLNQPASTAVGIAYMFNGEARIAQAPTADHALAFKALRPSTGTESAAASPYLSLSALAAAWPIASFQREVLAVTDGIDRFGDFGDFNMYVGQAISDAQRSGLIVYSLYAPALGHASHSPALIRWGQTYLSQVAEETGGESYISGALPPYLADVTNLIEHQYRVTFLAPAGAAPGLEPVRFTTDLAGVDLIASYRFLMPGPEVNP